MVQVRKELDQIEALHEEPTPVKKQVVGADDYLSQLKSAQENLFEHNSNINRLLEQIEMLKESEKKYADSLRINEQLNGQLSDTRKILSEKENEINQLRQQQRLNSEIGGRLDKAYSEFSVLQEKLQKLDKYLVQPHSSAEYAGLQESYFKLTKDFDDIKTKHSALWEENQRLSRILSDTEDKLREANFQRQQLQKKISFIEELNNDLQQVSEHNKKFESQLRRISEMEALLAKAIQEKSDYHNEPGQ